MSESVRESSEFVTNFASSSVSECVLVSVSIMYMYPCVASGTQVIE